MKKIPAFLLIAFCSAPTAYAQVVSEAVTFDAYVSAADNDFINRFDNGLGLVQLQTNGVTGGCLETPLSISWGNDNAVYCTRFKGVTGVTYITGIFFKYDTLQLDNTNFDRAASLWMKPNADPNHYLVASVLDTRRIQIISYSATNTSAVMNLEHGHWYNLLLIADFTGGPLSDQVDVNAQVNDHGITGNDPPFPTGFTTAVLHDSVLIADTAIEVSITGTRWGGALYLDNFRFDGMKSFDNCLATGFLAEANEYLFSVSEENKTLTLMADARFLNGEAEVFNAAGRKIAGGKITAAETKLDLSAFQSGVYFLSVKKGGEQDTRKFILD
jgi:hypothetical protein